MSLTLESDKWCGILTSDFSWPLLYAPTREPSPLSPPSPRTAQPPDGPASVSRHGGVKPRIPPVPSAQPSPSHQPSPLSLPRHNCSALMPMLEGVMPPFTSRSLSPSAHLQRHDARARRSLEPSADQIDHKRCQSDLRAWVGGARGGEGKKCGREGSSVD